MRTHRFHTTTTLPLPLHRVFAFFADAANLEVITPPELRFNIVTPAPIAMAEGALIEYRLRLMGIPFGWKTRIAVWEPPHLFVDEQLAGPYRSWVHTHRFAEVADGTRIEDEVVYALPLQPFGEVAAPVVNRQVARIFSYRAGAIRRALGPGPGSSTAR